MNKPLKELIGNMQKGWNKVPRNPTNGGSFEGYEENPTAACPLAHALLGKLGRLAFWDAAEIEFPILLTQKVIKNGRDKIDLSHAILFLADQYRWSTPQVIAWLKTHLKD